ncbi:homoserine kinase [Siccirubricoccus sp. KC 17139]|uniref:Homoserine kinase n=1 Tax=Siccirubricoccus soli TaxID=2899147 RepID=A0ABT1CYJ1_9PROT|nr:homoserine kinase [Siccirubricoccus soli]MCO6414724.1 homoserine kinase [Siccirubricoccus soli]MCP2680854.1 homoserine kinase [Siccirubricoccus soli]
MAVYTEVSDEALRAFLAEYELGELRAYRGIAEGVENSNYALQTGAGDFILTLYEKRVDPAELPYFLGLMQHLAARGLACPQPVAARDGQALRRLAGRPAAICTFLPGVWPRRVRPEHCAPLGEALARLHAAGADFPGRRPNALGPAGWAPLLDRCRAQGDAVQPGLIAQLDAALAGLLAAWPAAGALPEGQIHADLFPDNVFFLEGPGGQPQVSGLIDFYFACTDLLAYDLAVCLNAWCFEPDGAYNVTKARALIGAYHRQRPLSAAERAALPVLCRGAALRFLLTRLYDWTTTPPGALVTRKDPLEYLRKLRFFSTASGPEALGG